MKHFLRHLRRLRVAGRTIAVAAAILVAGCAADQAQRSATQLPALQHDDFSWLSRVSFGVDSEIAADYQRLGRAAYLESQLRPRETTLPASVSAAIAALDITRSDPEALLAGIEQRRQIIHAMPDGEDKERARKQLNEEGNRFAAETVRRDLLRAVHAPAQLQEEMVWFWLNHFSVYQHKAEIRWLIADYEESAIRPHVFGHFRDIVMATLEHPAMLQYLDNTHNAVGHGNENYARELLELHTLGVDGGYSQQDVQNLARILTGVGVNAGEPPHLRPELRADYVRKGAFEFNPARHDFGGKVLLGHAISRRGFGEVEEAVTLIVRQPACARFIARELATYFAADDPPPGLVDRMAKTFTKTDGDIAAVLRVMFMAPEFASGLGHKFKDPMRFVVSAVRFAYDGRPISNTRPLQNWLNGLGEASYAHQTPDGYSLVEAHWASSGQMSRRFDIARAIGSGNAGLFDAPDGAPATAVGFPQLSNRLFFAALEPFLTAPTRAALGAAASPQEWNTFLLASPDFAYE